MSAVQQIANGWQSILTLVSMSPSWSRRINAPTPRVLVTAWLWSKQHASRVSPQLTSLVWAFSHPPVGWGWECARSDTAPAALKDGSEILTPTLKVEGSSLPALHGVGKALVGCVRLYAPGDGQEVQTSAVRAAAHVTVRCLAPASVRLSTHDS